MASPQRTREAAARPRWRPLPRWRTRRTRRHTRVELETDRDNEENHEDEPGEENEEGRRRSARHPQLSAISRVHAGATGERLCPRIPSRAVRPLSGARTCDVGPFCAALRIAIRSAMILGADRGSRLAVRHGERTMTVQSLLPCGRFAVEVPGMDVPVMTMTLAQARVIADALDAVDARRRQDRGDATASIAGPHAEFGWLSDHELAIELPNAKRVTILQPAAVMDTVKTGVSGHALRLTKQVRSALTSEDSVDVTVEPTTRFIHMRSSGARSSVPLLGTDEAPAISFRVDAGVLTRALDGGPESDCTVHVDIDRRELFHERSIRANASRDQDALTGRVTFVIPIHSVHGRESAT